MKLLILIFLVSCTQLSQRSVASLSGADNYFEVGWCLESPEDNLKFFMPERFKITYVLPETYEVSVLTPKDNIVATEIKDSTRWVTYRTQELSFKEAHIKMNRIECPKKYENI